LKLSLLDAIANLAVAKMPFEAKLRILKEADKCPTIHTQTFGGKGKGESR